TFYSLFDPLNLIALLLPLKWIGVEYGLFIGIRLYLAGLFFLFLLQYQGIKSHKALLLATFFYVFNVTALYSAFRHPMFINGILWLPLIILGASHCLDGKKPYLLLVGAFFAFITQFYLSIYAAVAFLAFVVINLYLQRKTIPKVLLFKKLFKASLWFALGIFMAGFVLVPQLLAVYYGARAQSKGLLIYDSLYYLGTFSSFFIPMVSSSYTSALGNALVFFLGLVYFFQKPRDWKTIFFSFFSLMLLVSPFGYAINAFSYVNNRWSYLLLLPAGLALGEILEHHDVLQAEQYARPTKLMISFVVAMVFCLLAYLGTKWFYPSKAIIWQVFMAIIIVFLFVLINNPRFISSFWCRLKPLSLKWMPKVLIISYLVFGLAISLSYVFTQTTATNLAAYDHQEAFDQFPDDGFYRIDQSSYVLKSDYLGNDNLVYRFKSPYAYNSMVSGAIAEVIDYYQVYNLNSTVGYTGFNNRTALNAINQVRYMMIKSQDAKDIPYDFTEAFRFHLNEVVNPTIANGGRLTGKLEEVIVYESEHFLPFGFVYHQYLGQTQADSMNAIERENALLTHALIKDPQAEIVYPAVNKQLSTDVLYRGIVKTGTTYLCEEGAYLSFTIPAQAGRDVYFHADLFRELDNQKRHYYVEAYENNQLVSRFRETLYAKGTYFYYDNHEPLINLGSFATNEVRVKILFDPGRYEIINLGYYLNDVSDVKTKVNELKQETLQHLQFGTHGFSGDITLNEAGLLFISLPYSRGFTAYVNGKESKIERVNIGYMGLYLEAGYHEITFEYKTLGMSTGLYLSLASFMVTAGLVLINSRKKRDGH
ncbi:MAG TPA: YfhO family protein, partial [Bacilli bacterium]|nr:YfhO family protein [Bacilli bacterium]